MKKISILIFLISVLSLQTNAQLSGGREDSIMVRNMFDEALANGQSYEYLRQLCKDVGNRLSGSEGADKAVKWGEQLLKSLGFDTVYLQPIEVPVWIRGSKENFAILDGKKKTPIHGFSLGGSVATSGVMQAEVVEVNSLEEVKNMPEGSLKGKIVFYNRPMDPKLISTFQSYGGCVDQRYGGAGEAARKGAVGVLVRSMTLRKDHHPHTGSMGYPEDVNKIPAAAISTEDANKLSQLLKNSKKIEVSMEMDCRTEADKPSWNVIAELRGTVFPEKIIAFGGHLDSWDKGEGAHDDGAGIVHSIEAMRILKTLNYKPKYTLRVVLFMNEENGNRGGKTYAAVAKRNNEVHMAAIESDRGGFSPRGFSIDGNEEQVLAIGSYRQLLEPYGLHAFEKGYGGVDINPIKFTENQVSESTILLGLVPDSQRYFDFHHADTDVWENVNQRELELGCASMATMIYLLDRYTMNNGLVMPIGMTAHTH